MQITLQLNIILPMANSPEEDLALVQGTLDYLSADISAETLLDAVVAGPASNGESPAYPVQNPAQPGAASWKLVLAE